MSSRKALSPSRWASTTSASESTTRMTSPCRPPTSFSHQDVVPHLESGPFPTWVGVGGSPQSGVRAARYGFALMLAIIGGSPARFKPFSQLFGLALAKFERAPLPVGVHSRGHVAEA